jgi:phospholipase/lecithinase/hemolysin
MKKQARLCAALTGMTILPAAAVAGPYTGLIVFGDSLSDVGNDAIVTPQLAAFGIPATPGPYYYNGRFSNGPGNGQAEPRRRHRLCLRRRPHFGQFGAAAGIHR